MSIAAATSTLQDMPNLPTVATVPLGHRFCIPSQPHVVFALLDSGGAEVGDINRRWAVVVDADETAVAQGIRYGRLKPLDKSTPVIVLAQVRTAIYRRL